MIINSYVNSVLKRHKLANLTASVFPEIFSFIRIQVRNTIHTIPLKIRLDEDILKMSWTRPSSSFSEDVLIKTNIFTLVIRLQKVSSEEFFKTSCVVYYDEILLECTVYHALRELIQNILFYLFIPDLNITNSDGE